MARGLGPLKIDWCSEFTESPLYLDLPGCCCADVNDGAGGDQFSGFVAEAPAVREPPQQNIGVE
jgi:hypothetical protein